MAQAHWRKIIDLGLRQQYIEDESLSLSLRMLTALAFVPASHIFEAFNEIKSILEVADGFLEYMEETYIGKFSLTTEFRPSRQTGKIGPLVSVRHQGTISTLA